MKIYLVGHVNEKDGVTIVTHTKHQVHWLSSFWYVRREGMEYNAFRQLKHNFIGKGQKEKETEHGKENS